MVRMLGDIITLPGQIDEKRRLVMNGICDITNSHSWIWCLVESNSGKRLPYSASSSSDIDQERFACYLKALEAKRSRSLRAEAAQPINGFSKPASSGTASLRHYLLTSSGDDADLGDSVGPLLTCVHDNEDGYLSGIGIYRKNGQHPFDERSIRITRIILSELPWLHTKTFPGQGSKEGSRLYPRHRMVLQLLCNGWNRKKIALELGLSLHTVHSYTKTIYAHFGIHSQAELIAHLNSGNLGEHSIARDNLSLS